MNLNRELLFMKMTGELVIFKGRALFARASSSQHKGSVDHFEILWSKNCTILAIYVSRNELEPFWQFMAPEIAISGQFLATETAPFW